MSIPFFSYAAECILEDLLEIDAKLPQKCMLVVIRVLIASTWFRLVLIEVDQLDSVQTTCVLFLHRRLGVSLTYGHCVLSNSRGVPPWGLSTIWVGKEDKFVIDCCNCL
eukprot:jgi/Botrbrau1/4589/Bobra.60_2s0075.1